MMFLLSSNILILKSRIVRDIYPIKTYGLFVLPFPVRLIEMQDIVSLP